VTGGEREEEKGKKEKVCTTRRKEKGGRCNRHNNDSGRDWGKGGEKEGEAYVTPDVLSKEATFTRH